jgi:arginase
MKVQVILVPYDSGNRSLRMGRGPEHFIENGLVQALETDGHEVSVETIEAPTEFRAEVQTQFALYRSLAERVAAVRQNGRFPLVLSGNCGATVGVIAGAQTKQIGVVWFDAHGEFNTPETTNSGFLDGMGLAVAAGHCWRRLAASIPGFQPIPALNILLVGARDFDEGERERLEEAGGTVVDAATVLQRGMPEVLGAVMPAFLPNMEEVHLHLDLDALDQKETPANAWLPEGGIPVEGVSQTIRYIKGNRKITSATIASFDPEYDPQGKTLNASLKLIRQMLDSTETA